MKKGLPFFLITLLLALSVVLAVLYLSDGSRHRGELSDLRLQVNQREKQLLSLSEA